MNEELEREAFYEWEGQNDISPLEAWLARAARSTAPQAALSEDQREALAYAISTLSQIEGENAISLRRTRALKSILKHRRQP